MKVFKDIKYFYLKYRWKLRRLARSINYNLNYKDVCPICNNSGVVPEVKIIKLNLSQNRILSHMVLCQCQLDNQ